MKNSRDISGVRKDYLLRLIRSLRRNIEADPEVIQTKEECGEDAIIVGWMSDAIALCNVVEREVILNDNVPSITQEDFRSQFADPYEKELIELLGHIDTLLRIASDKSGIVTPEEQKCIEEAQILLWSYDYDDYEK